MDVGDLTPALVLTLGGASIVVSIILGALLPAIKPTPEQKDQFGPLLSLITGLVVVGAFAVFQGADLVSAALTGILAGGGAMGVHDAAKTVGIG